MGQGQSNRAEREDYINLAATRWARRQSVGGADERGRTLNPPIGQRILLELAFTADANGTSLLGQKALAAACLCGERTVWAWLNAFESQGIISRSNRSLKRGGRTSDIITLSLFAAAREQDQNRPGPGLGDPSERQGGVDLNRAQRGLRRRSQTAPGADPNRAGRDLLNKDNKNTPLPPVATEEALAIRERLTDLGISGETAEELMNAYALGGSTLNADNVRYLVHVPNGPDPRGRAVEILEEGLRMVSEGGNRRGQPQTAARLGKPRRHVDTNTQAELWDRCCRETGHKPSLTAQSGGWRFDADLVDRLELELSRANAAKTNSDNNSANLQGLSRTGLQL